VKYNYGIQLKLLIISEANIAKTELHLIRHTHTHNNSKCARLY